MDIPHFNIQTVCNVTQIHREELQGSQELADKMEEILESLQQAAEKVDEDMQQSLCLQKYMVSSKVA